MASDPTREPRSEADLRALGLSWECCDSCHDDDAYGYGMTERQTPSGAWFSACCRTPGDIAIAAAIEVRDAV
jgi:hypothetical protein